MIHVHVEVVRSLKNVVVKLNKDVFMKTVYENLRNNIKKSLKNQENDIVIILRCIDSSVQLKSKMSKTEITDDMVYEVIKSELKKVKDQMVTAEKVNRPDLLNKYFNEKMILEFYLPKQKTEEKIINIIKSYISDIGASSLKEMGNIIKLIKRDYGSAIDMGLVSKLVKEQLT